MNMQNKLYTMQFFSPPETDSQPVPEQPSQNPELVDFANFTKFMDFIYLTKLTEKTPKLLEKLKRSDKRGSELTKKRRLLAPQPTSIYKVSITSMVRSISINQPGLAAWLCSLPAPAHLLVS